MPGFGTCLDIPEPFAKLDSKLRYKIMCDVAGPVLPTTLQVERRIRSGEHAGRRALRFDEVDRFPVERNEGLAAKPAPFEGDRAIGEVAPGL